MSENEMLDRAVAVERARQIRSSLISLAVAVVFLSPIGWVIAHLMGVQGNRRAMLAPVIVAALLGGGLLVLKFLQYATSGMMMSFMNPGGPARSVPGHSRAESLAAAGRLDEATAEFESIRGMEGDTVARLRAEAELHTGSGGDAKRAEMLYLRIRRAPDAGSADELYASHRLIDLYLGPLSDSGRVMVELRRMADRFPDTVDGQSALVELRRRRDEEQS